MCRVLGSGTQFRGKQDPVLLSPPLFLTKVSSYLFPLCQFRCHRVCVSSADGLWIMLLYACYMTRWQNLLFIQINARSFTAVIPVINLHCKFSYMCIRVHFRMKLTELNSTLNSNSFKNYNFCFTSKSIITFHLYIMPSQPWHTVNVFVRVDQNSMMLITVDRYKIQILCRKLPTYTLHIIHIDTIC
jgi:hypothetical protein